MDETVEKRVYLGQIDVFDPERVASKNKPYAGEIGLVALATETLELAVFEMFSILKAEGLRIKSIDFFGNIGDFDGDIDLFGIVVEEFADRALSSELPVFSNTIAYENED